MIHFAKGKKGKENMKKFQELNLCDDFLFKMVMRDEKLVVGFLEMVLDLKGKIKGIKFIEEEKSFKNGYLDKSVRLDIYVVDEEETIYNIEIQNGKLINLPKRSRKYQANMDSRNLKPGEEYGNLKKQYIIFVCTGDPFGEGLYKYTFTNRCIEVPDLELNDGTMKVFLNTKGSKGDVSKELKAFLSFVEKSTVQNAATINDSYVAQLSAKIENIKRDEEIGGAFMTIEEKMEELARESANAKAMEIARKMKTEGFGIDQIVKLTGLTKEEIENI